MTQDERLLKLLEHLHHHNCHHAEELAEYQDEVGEQHAAAHVKASVELLNQANDELLKAIEVLRGRA